MSKKKKKGENKIKIKGCARTRKDKGSQWKGRAISN